MRPADYFNGVLAVVRLRQGLLMGQIRALPGANVHPARDNGIHPNLGSQADGQDVGEPQNPAE